MSLDESLLDNRPDKRAKPDTGPRRPYGLETAAFAAALLDPDITMPEGVGKNGENAPKRFSIYRNNVVVSLMEALSSTYPSILAIMGQENFDKVARVFVARHPPSSPMMQRFGMEFPAFLEGFKPLRNSPFLIDLAVAERAWLEAWHSVNQTALAAEELGLVEPDKTMDLTFAPLKATTLIQSAYPVCQLFGARNEWPVPDIDLSKGQNLLITRPDLVCITTPVDDPMAVFLNGLISGQTLGMSIAGALEAKGDFDPAAAIAQILATGAFGPLQLSRN